MKTISLIVPCYNEASNILDFYNQICELWSKKVTKYHYEIVFINDGSSDETAKKILECKAKDLRVVFIDFARNFGKEAAVTAGLIHCTGDAAIILDADLQYPIEKIPEFIKMWEAGSQHVIGLRDTKHTNNAVEVLGSKLFHFMMGVMLEQGRHNPAALDFRLIDREVVENFKLMQEQDRIVRGLLDWIGFEPVYIPYTEKARNAGVSHFNFSKRFNLALNSFVSHSLLPLRFIAFLGVTITFFSTIMGMYILIYQYILGNKIFSGPFMLGVLNTFLIGIVIMCLGLVAFYIGSIKREVLRRPIYIIRK